MTLNNSQSTSAPFLSAAVGCRLKTPGEVPQDRYAQLFSDRIVVTDRGGNVVYEHKLNGLTNFYRNGYSLFFEDEVDKITLNFKILGFRSSTIGANSPELRSQYNLNLSKQWSDTLRLLGVQVKDAKFNLVTDFLSHLLYSS